MKKLHIAFLSTYPPTQCGIATFTQSLINNRPKYDYYKVSVIAVIKKNSQPKAPVIFEIEQDHQEDYLGAADFINASDIDVVVIQHEYGIYGGENGEYILSFVRRLIKPIVISFHSVLDSHSRKRKLLTQGLLDRADSIVVMTKHAKKTFLKTFEVEARKIRVIPHGVPPISFSDKKNYKNYLGFSNNVVLSTYGLIGRGKGIDLALKSLSYLKSKFPNLKYLIIGVTHPKLLETEGESYRNELLDYIKRFDLSDNVIFINSFLKHDELIGFLATTDIYLAPQTDLKQAFSGTVAYTMGCGCAVVSTATSYAKEVLASQRGIITDSDPFIIGQTVEKLLVNNDRLQTIQRSAFDYAKKRTWPKVSKQYFGAVAETWAKSPMSSKKQSKIDVRHFRKLTDHFGMIQHCKKSFPDLAFGYSLDDQARALIVCLQSRNLKLAPVFLKFIIRSIDSRGIVHNFFSRHKKPTDRIASPVAYTRTFWALSSLLNNPEVPTALKLKASAIIEHFAIKHQDVHTASYLLLGYVELNSKIMALKITRYLLSEYEKNRKENWNWFSDKLTWSNGIALYALAKSYGLLRKERILQTVIEATTFLEKASSHPEGFPNPIGNGWYAYNKMRSTFDQQPLEASSMVLLYSQLFLITNKLQYLSQAKRWMSWYHGNNIANETMINQKTGGVYDGITKNGIQKNEGAESIVTYLLAQLAMGDLEHNRAESSKLSKVSSAE